MGMPIPRVPAPAVGVYEWLGLRSWICHGSGVASTSRSRDAGVPDVSFPGARGLPCPAGSARSWSPGPASVVRCNRVPACGCRHPRVWHV